MESGDDSNDPPYKEESSEESDSTSSAAEFVNQKRDSPVNSKTPSRSSGSSAKKKTSSGSSAGKNTSSVNQGPRIGVQIQSPPEQYTHCICEGYEMCTQTVLKMCLTLFKYVFNPF